MQEKKNTPKIIVCVCEREREKGRDGGRNNLFVMENYAKNERERITNL